jgi:PAT family beta-lactamase induction signal transducer AmpG
MTAAKRPLAETLLVYLRPRVLVVALLGFSAGLPLALSGATLAVWMADRGVDLSTIGLLALAGQPYALKFLWAPIVDAVEVPLLSRLLGRRRGWLVATQLALMAAILLLGTRDPNASPLLIGLGALLVAFASATQDIVIDAYRVESLPGDEQAAGMASYVAAYRLGMLASGAGVLGTVAWLEARGVGAASAWPVAYAVCALLVMVGLLATLLGREPGSAGGKAPAQEYAEPVLARLWRTAKSAFADFLTREAAVAVLAFVVLYKLCDALAGTLTGPFVLSLGYDKASYAAIVKGVGLAASLLGGFAGGFIANALTLAQALWLGAILQMASNLAFVWLAQQTASNWALATAIVTENVCGAIGTVIFVAYLSALCSSPLHTATQYALLTAFAAIGRTYLSSGSGYAAQSLGWPLFFIATALAALPSLALLAWLQRRRHFVGMNSKN